MFIGYAAHTITQGSYFVKLWKCGSYGYKDTSLLELYTLLLEVVFVDALKMAAQALSSFLHLRHGSSEGRGEERGF